MSSFEVIDLGTDVSPQKFVEAVQAHQPQFVGCSALLTTTMPPGRPVARGKRWHPAPETILIFQFSH